MQNHITGFPPLPQMSRDAVVALAAATQALVDFLDTLGGDPDAEDATDAEDEGIQPLHCGGDGPGCRAADEDSCLAADDDPERLVGDGKPGDSSDAEENGDTEPNGDEGDYSDGDYGTFPICGVDQTRPIGADNPECR